MARPLPKRPDPSVAITDASGRVQPAWLDFFAELQRRVPVTGEATFAAATTVAVTLAVPETDAAYRVLLDPAENRTLWVSNKTTTGFTINASSSSSATVGWALLRT